MKYFFMMLLMTSFLGSFAMASEHGEKEDAICPALLELTTRTMGKNPSDISIKLPTKTGSIAQ